MSNFGQLLSIFDLCVKSVKRHDPFASQVFHMPRKKLQPAFISQQVTASDYFFLDLKTNKSAKLSIACGGKEQCATDYDLKRERFLYFAVEFVMSGRGEYTVDNQVYPLRAGSVFAYGPETAHRIRCTDRNGMIKYFVDFHGKSAKTLLRNSPLNQAAPLQLTRTRWVEMIFDLMIVAGNEPQGVAKAQCEHLLPLLLMRLASDSQASQINPSPAYETYMQCREYIQNHYMTLHSISQVADACHLDPAYLSRLFKRFAGEGAYQYLVQLKMQQAAELLVMHKKSVKAVASIMGYHDIVLFSKSFKRVYGLSPKGFVQSINR